MTGFNESAHPRSRTGKFTRATWSESGVLIEVPGEDVELVVGEEYKYEAMEKGPGGRRLQRYRIRITSLDDGVVRAEHLNYSVGHVITDDFQPKGGLDLSKIVSTWDEHLYDGFGSAQARDRHRELDDLLGSDPGEEVAAIVEAMGDGDEVTLSRAELITLLERARDDVWSRVAY